MSIDSLMHPTPASPRKDRPVVTVFGSSRPKPGEREYEDAYAVGSELARAGFTVCNGAYAGTMEASARGAKTAGGLTIGVGFTALGPKTRNAWIDQFVQEDTLINRMMRLVTLGDAYVVLKGGTGTLLELAAVWEHVNKGLMEQRPIVALGEFWSGVVETLNGELSWEGREDCTKYVTRIDDPHTCAAFLKESLLRRKSVPDPRS